MSPAHLAAVGDGSWGNATPSRLGLPDWRTREGASFPITQYNQTDSLNFPSISFVSQHHLFFLLPVWFGPTMSLPILPKAGWAS